MMRFWYPWADEALLYACDDTAGSGMFLFWAAIYLDGDDGFHALMFGVENGRIRSFADAPDIVVDSLEQAEAYLEDEGMTDGDVIWDLDGIGTHLGLFQDYGSAKRAIEAWFGEHQPTDCIC